MLFLDSLHRLLCSVLKCRCFHSTRFYCSLILHYIFAPIHLISPSWGTTTQHPPTHTRKQHPIARELLSCSSNQPTAAPGRGARRIRTRSRILFPMDDDGGNNNPFRASIGNLLIFNSTKAIQRQRLYICMYSINVDESSSATMLN